MNKIFGVEIWKLIYDVLLGIGLGLLIGEIYENNWFMVFITSLVIGHIMLTRQVVELDRYVMLLSGTVKRLQMKITELVINNSK